MMAARTVLLLIATTPHPMKLFLALALPEPIEDELWPLHGGVPGADWTAPADHHLTLRFLGEVPPDRQLALEQALRSFRFASLPLQLRGLGHFPPRGRPKVLWAGLADNPELLRLQTKLERLVVGLGFGPEPRQYAPHVTLARLRNSPPHRVAEWLGAHGLFAGQPWQADEIVLFSSRGLAGETDYQVEARFAAVGGPVTSL